MKDYYKILGIPEGASQEEIRNRWVELSKIYHPDRGGGGDERIKEINEAYEVLRNELTRLDYDMKRALERSIPKGIVKRVYKKRFLLAFGGAFLFIISGLALLSILKSSTTSLQKSFSLLEKAEKEPSLIQEGKPKRDSIPEKKELKPETKIQPSVSSSKLERITRSVVLSESTSTSRNEEPDPPLEPLAEITGSLDSTSHSEPSSPNLLFESTSPKQTASLELTSSSKPTFSSESLPSPTPVEQHTLILQKPDERASSLSHRISTLSTEMVREFLTTYIERYTRKDLQGFLSLFSLEAIQNGKEGLDAIKKIYNDFFNQSDELRYHLEGLIIAISQNQAEVNAQYKIRQKLKDPRKEKVWEGRVHWVLVQDGEMLKIKSLNYQPKE